MPTSLFQYEMLPTTWFYMSSLLILAVFFRFNRLFSIRNLDVIFLLSTTPGLVYIAMGSALQGYLWLYVIGAALFFRLAFDVFLRRRPMLAPNLNFAGLVFSCVASSAFMIPNLFLNWGDACESPRAWRLEQILAAADEADPDVSNVANWPGYPPFLQATADVNRFFAPSQVAWNRAVADMRIRFLRHLEDMRPEIVSDFPFQLGKQPEELVQPVDYKSHHRLIIFMLTQRQKVSLEASPQGASHAAK